MQKYSRQRESIKHYLDTHRTHPTAEIVYQNVKQQFPNISLGTVYRNLNLLAERGEILRISLGNGPDHYDADCSPHYHFICKQCGTVLDIDLEHQAQLDEIAARQFNGTITNHVTHFFGLCPKCNTKNI